MEEPAPLSDAEIDDLRNRLRLLTVPTISAELLSLRIGANKSYVGELIKGRKVKRPREPFVSRLLEQLDALEDELRVRLEGSPAAPP